MLDALRWLGLDWDEGPEVGGPYAPYRQSERRELHRDVVRRLVEAGEAYESFSTPEGGGARQRAAGREPKPGYGGVGGDLTGEQEAAGREGGRRAGARDPKLGYDGSDRALTDEQKRAFREGGRGAVIRLRMPDEGLEWEALVRGETVFRAGTVPDFALTRGNGVPLYTLVNPVDDA